MSLMVGVRSYPARNTLMGIDSPRTGAPSMISYLGRDQVNRRQMSRMSLTYRMFQMSRISLMFLMSQMYRMYRMSQLSQMSKTRIDIHPF